MSYIPDYRITVMDGNRGSVPPDLVLYDQMKQHIEEEINVLRKLGMSQKLLFILQLQPKQRNAGSCSIKLVQRKLDPKSEIQITIRMNEGKKLARKYDDSIRIPRKLAAMLFTLRHECGHAHHYYFNADSIYWSKQKRESWAHSYALARGSDPKQFDTTYQRFTHFSFPELQRSARAVSSPKMSVATAANTVPETKELSKKIRSQIKPFGK